MVVEQLIFTVISFAIFVFMFFRMIRNNDTTYVIVLVLETIGIALNFLEVFGIKLNIIFIMLKYILAIILPIIIVILEKRGIHLYEIINLSKSKLYLMLGNNKKAKEVFEEIFRALLRTKKTRPKKAAARDEE